MTVLQAVPTSSRIMINSVRFENPPGFVIFLEIVPTSRKRYNSSIRHSNGYIAIYPQSQVIAVWDYRHFVFSPWELRLAGCSNDCA